MHDLVTSVLKEVGLYDQKLSFYSPETKLKFLVKAARKRFHLQLSELADLAGLRRQDVFEIEQDQCRLVRYKTVFVIQALPGLTENERAEMLDLLGVVIQSTNTPAPVRKVRGTKYQSRPSFKHRRKKFFKKQWRQH